MIETSFGPRVSKVHEEDESEDDEECGADEGEVVAPKDEERVRNSERDGDEDEPQQDLGTPPTVQRMSIGALIMMGVLARFG